MKGLFGYEISKGEKPVDMRIPVAVRANPMIAAYGQPEDTTLKCKDCKHLYYKEFVKRYYKCSFRGDTRGPGTDHRKHWPACGKYEKDNEN